MVAEMLNPAIPFDAAVRESRKLFPDDTGPRADAPEGNATLVVERFSSPSLAQALGNGSASGDFSVVYTRDSKANITSIVLGLGDDLDALLRDSSK